MVEQRARVRGDEAAEGARAPSGVLARFDSGQLRADAFDQGGDRWAIAEVGRGVIGGVACADGGDDAIGTEALQHFEVAPRRVGFAPVLRRAGFGAAWNLLAQWAIERALEAIVGVDGGVALGAVARLGQREDASVLQIVGWRGGLAVARVELAPVDGVAGEHTRARFR